VSSKLTERLRDIIGPPRASPPESSNGLRPPVSEVPGRVEPRLLEVLGGEWRHEGGRSFVIERRVDAGTFHGRVRVGELSECHERAASFAPLLSGGSPARPPFVFFDLETTGLSGGAGTLAFLVGCGWFDSGGAFVTRQHVLTQFGDEPGMLHAVAGELERAGALVSFNGRSFDAPVLETRYLFHRLQWPGESLPHIDVVHPSRRFWRDHPDRLSGCSLLALERQVLGVHRTGDIPGFDVPGRFFQYVRSSDPRPLVAVLEHNRHDLLSLAAITARLLCLLAAGPGEARDPCEALALGRAYERAGFEGRANESFERVLSMMDDGEARRQAKPLLKIEALRALAFAARRNRKYGAAAARWRQIVAMPGCPTRILREATEALAIHNEHRARDLAAAKAFALQSLAADARPTFHQAVRHRLARIDRKIERSTESLNLLDYQF
jgi:uncharacterized protein YprB with RNaseH-like and TPR domain